MTNILTAEFVRSAIHYDPATGIITWRSRDDVLPRVNKRFAGKRAAIPLGPDCYPLIRLKGRLYGAHRIIWLYVTGKWPEREIDHRDCDKGNNIWTNLREATPTENKGNQKRRVDNTTGLKGVCYRPKRKKWTAQIKDGPKIRYLGIFECPVAAHLTWVVAADRASLRLTNPDRNLG